MVELVGVVKRFSPSSVAVDDVSLTIRAGEFLTLLGPSGCGKTTVLRMISGFETPTVGRVLLEGRDVTDTPPYRRDVNQVFQSYALFPHLSVRRNIEFGLRMKRLPRAERNSRVEQAVAMLNLGGLETRKPSQLSGGQKQRVALARAIVNRPKVLLLDEPLAALDAKLRRSVQLELKQLQRVLGITFVFVTHDQEEALTMSDRIAVMNRGRIEQVASATEIYHRPTSAFVADFVGQTNLLRPIAVRRENDRLRARVDDAIEFELVAGAPIDGLNFSLSVRPEKISFGSTIDEATCNTFRARVIQRIFRGEVTSFRLRCASGLELDAIVTETGASATHLAVDSEVVCTIHPDDIVMLIDPKVGA